MFFWQMVAGALDIEEFVYCSIIGSTEFDFLFTDFYLYMIGIEDLPVVDGCFH